jgi:hypothetical protein
MAFKLDRRVVAGICVGAAAGLAVGAPVSPSATTTIKGRRT